MTEPKFTPGPWTFKAAETYAIKDANMDTLATANWLHLRGRRKDEEVIANAHLIAAAPALYEALSACLEELMSVYHSEFDGVWEDSDFARVEAQYLPALAKARGEI